MTISTDLAKHIIWQVVQPNVEFFLLRALHNSEFPVAILSGTVGAPACVRDIRTTIAGVITLASRGGFGGSAFNFSDFVGLLWLVHNVSTAGPSTAMLAALKDHYDAMDGNDARKLSEHIIKVRDDFQNRGINTTLDEGDAELVAALRLLNGPYFDGFVTHLKAQLPGAVALGGDGRPVDPEDCKAVLRPMLTQLGQVLKKDKLFSEGNIDILIQNPPRSLPAFMALQLRDWTSAEKHSLWAPIASGLQQAKDHLQRMSDGLTRSDIFQLDVEDIIGELPTQKEAENDPTVLVPTVAPSRAAAVRGSGVAATGATQRQQQSHQLPQAQHSQHYATATATGYHQTQAQSYQAGSGQGVGYVPSNAPPPVQVPPPKCQCEGGTRDARLAFSRKRWKWYYNCRDWDFDSTAGCKAWKLQDDHVKELELQAAGRAAPNCLCSIPAVLRTSNSANNPGRHFYNCRNSFNGGCGFFSWVD